MMIAVIGAGTMGRGIAQVAACFDHKVVLVDKKEKILLESRDSLSYFMNRLAEKGKITNAESKRYFGNIHFSEDLYSCRNADVVIEAIVEDLDVKKSVFSMIEEIVREDCILASNTSSLSITKLASSCRKPGRFLGVHFFNPAPIMKLVELIPAIQTEKKYLDVVASLLQKWEKKPVKVKDTPAFIVNRVARPFYGEALRIVEENTATVEMVDWAMKELGGFRMGPFELMDYIGHDINYKVTESVFSAFYYDKRYIPSFLQKNLVDAGYLGRKTGRGFYNYAEDSNQERMTFDRSLARKIVDRIVVMLINEAADALRLGVASRDDIDTAMRYGTNYPKGLLMWADEIGIETCVQRLDALHDRYREERYRCSPILRTMMAKGETFYN